jgi:3-deoxy-D-manno-octulosonate 8-phosphate phosphatase (KDO 8-P phosphatase)
MPEARFVFDRSGKSNTRAPDFGSPRTLNVPISYLANLPADILSRAAKIRLAVFDVDGTLTDGRLWYAEDGHETKVFHVHDGLGLKRLQAHGVQVALITARISHPVALRAEELDINHVYQGQGDKRACLSELLDALHLQADQVAYVGDDLPDLAPMRMAGLAVAVANAHPWIVQEAHWQTRQRGGEGAAREVCDLILLAQGKSDAEREHWL